MAKDSFKEWEKVLNPETLKKSLIQASLYLTAYEILKNGIIDRLKHFYTYGWRHDDKTGEMKAIVSDEYKTDVIALYPKDEFQACYLW